MPDLTARQHFDDFVEVVKNIIIAGPINATTAGSRKLLTGVTACISSQTCVQHLNNLASNPTSDPSSCGFTQSDIGICFLTVFKKCYVGHRAARPPPPPVPPGQPSTSSDSSSGCSPPAPLPPANMNVAGICAALVEPTAQTTDCLLGQVAYIVVRVSLCIRHPHRSHVPTASFRFPAFKNIPQP